MATEASNVDSRVAGSGLVACQLDSYLKQLEARVLSCEEVQIPKPDDSNSNGEGSGGGSKKKKKKKSKKKQMIKAFEVILNDTCLFPEGGGQPCDHGSINGNPVTNVFRNADGVVVHHCLESFNVDDTVTVKLDWERRFDHMQQHSAQHLISALAEQHFGWHTTSWGLLRDVTTIDLDCRVADAHSKIDELEAMVNDYIRNGIDMTAKEYAVSEASGLDDLRVGDKGLPEGLKSIRIVRIDGLESNACCGTHVQSLAHLQMIKFCGVNKTSRGSLVTFLAGNRVLRYLTSSLTREQDLNKLLTCGPQLYVSAVERLKAEIKEKSAEQKRLIEELNVELATSLVERAKSADGFGHLHRDTGDPRQLAQLGNLALELGEHVHTILLTCGNPSETGSGGFSLVGRDADRIKRLGAECAGILGGRGGGSKGVFQGKVKSFEKLDEAIAAIKALE